MTSKPAGRRGRPPGSKNLKSRGISREEFAINGLREIASGQPLIDGMATLGLPLSNAGIDSQAFRWAQNYAAGLLKRLDENTV